MLTIFTREHRRSTALCFLGAVAALFLAQLPNDTRSEWFRSLTRPEVLPRELERKIGFIWTGIFLLAGFGAAAALAADQPKRWKSAIVGLTLLTLALNMTYTFVFTHQRDLAAATGIAAGLAGVIAILIVIASIRRIWLTALCHLPHILWVGFATYVTYRIDLLNPVTP